MAPEGEGRKDASHIDRNWVIDRRLIARAW
jgi:hypothetical protein